MVSNKSLKPFFSIITCTRNSSVYLPECLKSLASQSFQDFEHIVIDGESTDSTLSLLKNSSVKLFSYPPSGIASAMNQGIKHVSGKYVYFLHSDDQLTEPCVLQQVHDFLISHRDIDWAYGQIIETNGEGEEVGRFPARKIFQSAHKFLLYIYNYIPHQGVFMKKGIFARFGDFNTKYKICMDYDYWLRIGGITKWSYMPVVVAKYRVHKESVSGSTTSIAMSRNEKVNLRLRHLFKIQ